MTRTFDADYYDDLCSHLAQNVNDRAESLGYTEALWRSVKKFTPELDQNVAECILDASWTDPREDHLDALEGDETPEFRQRWKAFSVLVQDVDNFT